MKVIGAGFGRTGTMSLKVGLQDLGFGPCLHMIDLLGGYPELSETFLAAYQGQEVDWRSALSGWESTVDWPGCSFYKEFMEIYPDAPVILTVRDPESWYRSVQETIYGAALAMTDQPGVSEQPVSKMLKALVWEGDFAGRFEDKQRTLQVFERHNQEVREYVPAERLLVFEVKQGWAPLCDFLGVPVPEGPFPHVNDSESFKKMVSQGAHMSGKQAEALNKA